MKNLKKDVEMKLPPKVCLKKVTVVITLILKNT